MKLRELLYNKDPYNGFTLSDKFNEDSKVSGWNYDREYFDTIIDEIKPKVILEVGTWLGGSAIRMAKAALKHTDRKDLEILCIDTFLGDQHFWEKGDATRDLKPYFGYPSVYYDFLSNVVLEGLEDVITPFPISSHCGLKFLGRKGITFDLAYIDASHEYEDVFTDISLTKPICKTLFGDDFYSFMEVGQAVTDHGGVPKDEWFWRIDF